MRIAPLVLVITLSLSSTMVSQAQGGVRLIFWDAMRFGRSNWATCFGLGYDHDMNERLSLGIQARVLAESDAQWAVDYRTAFHLSENDQTSFYIGPQVSAIGYEAPDGNSMLFPIGMRCGVRGGLERFYADVFVATHYTVGSAAVRSESRDRTMGASTIELGLHMGWGWDKAR